MPHPLPDPPPLDNLLYWAGWAVQNRARINYAEIRPIPVELSPGSLPFTTDCSGFVTLMAKWAGLPDPNGLHFDGQGYTGTLLSHCLHIPFVDVRPGCLVVFGPYPGHHVILVTGLVRDRNGPLTDLECVSHGKPGDPSKVLASVEQARQPFPASYLTWHD